MGILGKVIKYLFVSVLLICLVGCNIEPFERDYNVVDGEFPRLLSIQFDNPEVAPGDTVTIRSYWAGIKISPEDVKWDVAWKYATSPYGSDIALDRQALEPYIVGNIVEIPVDSHTQCFEMNVAVPADIMLESPGIPENWADILRQYNIDFDPSIYNLPTSKDGILGMLDSLAALPDEVKSQIPEEMGYNLNGLCQLTAIKFRLYFDYTAADGFFGKFDHPVRYHSRLAAVPGIQVNHRPEITEKRLYVVGKDEVDLFYPESDAYEEVITISDSLTFKFDKKKSYFIEVVASERDTTVTTNAAFATYQPSYEEFQGEWFSDKNGQWSIGMGQQKDIVDRNAGRSRMIFKLFFGDDGEGKEEANLIEFDTPLLYWFESYDLKYGTSFRPRGRDLDYFWITVTR